LADFKTDPGTMNRATENHYGNYADEAYFADSKKDNYTSGGFEPENTDGEGFFPTEDDELPF